MAIPELQTPNLFDAQVKGYQVGQSMLADQRQNRLRELLPQALNAAPDQRTNMLGQIGGLDPSSMVPVSQVWDRLDNDKKQALAQQSEQIVRTLAGIHALTDPAQKMHAWQQTKQQAIAMGGPVAAWASSLSDDPEQGIMQAYSHVAPYAELSKQLNFGQETKWTPVNVPRGTGYVLMETDGKGTYRQPNLGGQQAPQQQQGAPPQGMPAPQGQQVNAPGMDDKVAFAMNAMKAQGMPDAQIEAWAQQQMGGQPPAQNAPQATPQPASYASAAPPPTAPPTASASAGLYPGGTPQLGVKDAPTNQGEIAKRTKEIADLQAQGVAMTPAQQHEYLLTGKTSADNSLTNGDPLSGLSPQDAALVKKLATYQVKPSELGTRPSAGGMSRLELIARATMVNPDYNVSSAEEANKFLTGLASKSLTAPGGQVESMNTAMNHLGTMLEVNAKLHTGKYPAINAVSNFFNTATGGAEVNNWNQAKTLFGLEVAKMVKGGVASEAEAAQIMEPFNAAGSPEQRNAAIVEATKFVYGRIKAIEDNRDRLLGSMSPGTSLMSANGEKIIRTVFGRLAREPAPDMMPADDGGSYSRNSTTPKPAGDGWTITKVK